MKNILEICEFSKGVCGVFTRVLAESLEFSKLGHKVTIFSSNVEKGAKKEAEFCEEVGSVSIRRFKSSKTVSKNVHNFNFEQELIKLRPDLVITHLIHPHSFQALKICLKLKIPCYLVTHAPFNVKRDFPLNFLTWIYSQFRVRPLIKKFDGIISITRWEIPYLLKLGVKKEKIIYIPNGIPSEFVSQKISNKNTGVLFLGRLSPVKSLETLLQAAKFLPQVKFTLTGSSEQEYLEKILSFIKINNLKNVRINPPVFNLYNKIRLIDSHRIFVLPSKREAMPQVLLEAMARGRLVISSRTDGGKEIIQDRKTGFLFDIGNPHQLVRLIKENINGNSKIQKNAEKEARKYLWENLIKSYSELVC